MVHYEFDDASRHATTQSVHRIDGPLRMLLSFFGAAKGMVSSQAQLPRAIAEGYDRLGAYPGHCRSVEPIQRHP